MGLVLLFILPFEDLLAGFAIYQGEASSIVRYEPQIALIGLILTIAGMVLSFFIPTWRGAARKSSELGVKDEANKAANEGNHLPHTDWTALIEECVRC